MRNWKIKAWATKIFLLIIVFRNKGGIAIRFDIDNSSLSFINCHLEAGENAVKERLDNITMISEKLFN